MNRSFLSIACLVCAALPASAQVLSADFDTFVEGLGGLTVTDGSITVLNLDRGLPGFAGDFTFDRADGALTGITGFTPTIVLGFGGLAPGNQPAFGRCKSFDVQWSGGPATSASIEVFDFGSYAGNTISLQALSGTTVVASSAFTITAPFSLGHHTLTVAAPAFDGLRLIGGGAQDSGVFFGCVDSIRVGLVPPPSGSLECFGDDQLTSCPCSNESGIADQAGCTNSLGFGGRLRAAGLASLSADGVVLTGSLVPNGPALYFQGSNNVLGGVGASFGDGLRCAGGTIVRLAVKTSVAGSSQFPGGSDPALSVRGIVLTPGPRWYQLWYRDSAAFCTASTFNTTNAVRLDWGT